MPLPEPINQSQSQVQSQILPRPLSQHQPIDPNLIPQQIGPKIQHRPICPIMILMQDLHQNLLILQIL